jgi:putative acetyltransferase
MTKLRKSMPEDGSRIVEIWCDAVDATHDFLSLEDRAVIEAEVRRSLPEAALWVAVNDDNRVIGFMGLSGSHMDSLFIDPSHRGAGVGRLLIQHAAALHGSVTTDVNEQNAQAVGFYRRLDFVPTGRSAKDDQGRAYPLIHMRRDVIS